MDKKNDFSDLLHIPTREERIARLKARPTNVINPDPIWRTYPNVEITGSYKVFNSDWLTDDEGYMMHRKTGWEIMAKRDLGNLERKIEHLMQKTWFDANTFLPAYFHAVFVGEFAEKNDD